MGLLSILLRHNNLALLVRNHEARNYRSVPTNPYGANNIDKRMQSNLRYNSGCHHY